MSASLGSFKPCKPIWIAQDSNYEVKAKPIWNATWQPNQIKMLLAIVHATPSDNSQVILGPAWELFAVSEYSACYCYMATKSALPSASESQLTSYHKQQK